MASEGLHKKRHPDAAQGLALFTPLDESKENLCRYRGNVGPIG